MSKPFSRREENEIITRNINEMNFTLFFNSLSDANKSYLKNKINTSLKFLIILRDEKKKSLSELSNKIIQLKIDSQSLYNSGLVENIYKAIEKRHKISDLTEAIKDVCKNIEANSKDIVDFTRKKDIIIQLETELKDLDEGGLQEDRDKQLKNAVKDLIKERNQSKKRRV